MKQNIFEREGLHGQILVSSGSEVSMSIGSQSDLYVNPCGLSEQTIPVLTEHFPHLEQIERPFLILGSVFQYFMANYSFQPAQNFSTFLFSYIHETPDVAFLNSLTEDHTWASWLKTSQLLSKATETSRRNNQLADNLSQCGSPSWGLSGLNQYIKTVIWMYFKYLLASEVFAVWSSAIYVFPYNTCFR